jgi:osmotically-inducible protein OsmY
VAIAEFTTPVAAVSPVSSPARTDVAELAARALGASDFGALRRIRCDFFNGCLTLRGTVASFHLKQIAQTLVRDLPGVSRIANRVEVAIS